MPDPTKPKRHLGCLVGSLALASLILLVAFVPRWRPPSLVSVSTLLHNKARYTGELLRVRGELVRGTLHQAGTPCHTKFSLESEGVRLRVDLAECVVPDSLRDDPRWPPEVTAEGALEPDGHFEATHLLVRSYGGYEMRQRPLEKPSPLEKLKTE